MLIDQISVFVENKTGRLAELMEVLNKNGIDIRAMTIADTADFGILRLIVNDNDTACKTLTDEGYLLKTTKVVGVKIGDEPGKLSKALGVLDENSINMEYLYAFMARTEKHAYVVLRVADNSAAEAALEKAGFHLITDADVIKL